MDPVPPLLAREGARFTSHGETIAGVAERFKDGTAPGRGSLFAAPSRPTSLARHWWPLLRSEDGSPTNARTYLR